MSRNVCVRVMIVHRILKSSVCTLVALAALFGFSSISLADCMVRAPAITPYRSCANWSGPYGGLHAGAGFAQTDWNWLSDNFFDNGPGDRSKIDTFGYIAGIHGGIQHQMG